MQWGNIMTKQDAFHISTTFIGVFRYDDLDYLKSLALQGEDNE